MQMRLNLVWLLAAALLLAPVAHAEEPATESAAVQSLQEGEQAQVVEAPEKGAQGDAAPQLQVQEPNEEENDLEPKATKTDVEAVHAEVEVLRDQWQRSLDRAYPYTVVQSNRPLIISGTGQFRFAQNKIFFPGAPANTYNSFSIPFFSINFTGNLRRDYQQGKNVDYTLGIQTTGLSSVSITDAWLTYQVLNSLDKERPRLSITAGQQKKYFGIEATATEAFKPTIVLAQFASKLNLDQRDIGLVLAGDLFPANDYGYGYRVPLLQYWFGLINGGGPNTLEANNNKDFFGRFQLNAPVNYDHPLRGLSVGISGYRGWASNTASNNVTNTSTFTSTASVPTVVTTSTTTTNIVQKAQKERWGADLAYVNTPVGFTLEYVRGSDVVPSNGSVTTKDGAVTKSVPYGFKRNQEEGYTATVFYNFGDQFVNAAKAQDRFDDFYPLTYQPFVRFDRWTPDITARSVHTDVYTAGFNWFFAQTTKLQINYNRTRDRKAGAATANTDQLLAQFQFGF